MPNTIPHGIETADRCVITGTVGKGVPPPVYTEVGARTNERALPTEPEEGFQMRMRVRTSATEKRAGKPSARTVILGLLGLVLGPVGAARADVEHHDPAPPTSSGEPGPNGGIQFPTGFIIGITGVLIDRVTDCESGQAIPPERLRAEFLFREGASRPYHLEDLEKIVLTAVDPATGAVTHGPKEITSFLVMQFRVGMLTLTFIVPLEGAICLPPHQPQEEPPHQPAGDSECTCRIKRFQIQLLNPPLKGEAAVPVPDPPTSGYTPVLQLGSRTGALFYLEAEGKGQITLTWKYGLKDRSLVADLFGTRVTQSLPDAYRLVSDSLPCTTLTPLPRGFTDGDPYRLQVLEYDLGRDGQSVDDALNRLFGTLGYEQKVTLTFLE